jgi:hypothetical protein
LLPAGVVVLVAGVVVVVVVVVGSVVVVVAGVVVVVVGARVVGGVVVVVADVVRVNEVSGRDKLTADCRGPPEPLATLRATSATATSVAASTATGAALRTDRRRVGRPPSGD